MCLSNNSSQSIEQVAKGAQGQLWWQFYPRQDMGASQELLERAQGAGYTAMVITVDQQASYYERSQHDRNLGGRTGGAGRGAWSARARRERRVRVAQAARTIPKRLGTATIGRGAAVPGSAGAAGAPPAAARRGAAAYRVGGGRLWYSWEYLDQVRKFIKIPIIIKGIVTAEDARICVERGFDGIVVSNHGGRSMDYGPSTLEALPEIVAAVNGKIPVMIDSGFRRGSDVLKALALGADAVWLGRAARWALGAFGPVGVAAAADRHHLQRTGRCGGGDRKDDARVNRFEHRQAELAVALFADRAVSKSRGQKPKATKAGDIIPAFFIGRSHAVETRADCQPDSWQSV